VEDCIDAGNVIGADVWLTPEAHAKLCAKYRDSKPPLVILCLRKLRLESAGLGPGFAEAVLTAGKIVGSNLHIDRAALDAIRLQHAINQKAAK
jgi:hypothetical protein